MLGVGSQPAVLVLRGGALEIEPWFGTLRPQGADLSWDHAVSTVSVSIYKAEGPDQGYDLGDPVSLSGVHSIAMDFRVNGSRLVERAVVVTLEENAVTIKGSALVKRGDVWVHPGFVEDGRRKPVEIAVLELLRQDGQVVARYQNPDMGRRFRYRVKLTGRSQ
jgi:hypothetical protein